MDSCLSYTQKNSNENVNSLCLLVPFGSRSCSLFKGRMFFHSKIKMLNTIFMTKRKKKLFYFFDLFIWDELGRKKRVGEGIKIKKKLDIITILARCHSAVVKTKHHGRWNTIVKNNISTTFIRKKNVFLLAMALKNK